MLRSSPNHASSYVGKVQEDNINYITMEGREWTISNRP